MEAPLQVGIVGAGIAGLSAAVALRRAGAEVEIFEMMNLKADCRVATTIAPNGGRILRSWGFDDMSAKADSVRYLRLVDALTLKPALAEFLEPEARPSTYYRSDLQRQLRYMATADYNHQPGVPAVLLQGSAVISVDCESGEIRLGNGVLKRKDLVVIADGFRSSFIKNITGKEEPLKDVGWSAYRLSLRTEHLPKMDDYQKLFPWGHWAGFGGAFDIPRAFYMMTEAYRGGSKMNVFLRHTTQPGEGRPLPWDATARRKDVLKIVSDYHPVLGNLVEEAEQVKEFNLRVREPLETFNKGRAVLIGDAAHTFMPTHAQGAALAIEEAAALFQLFNGVRERERVGSRLNFYTKVLKKRIHMVQYLSNALPVPGDENRRKAEELWGEGLYSAEEHSFSKPVRDFFFSYDVHAEMDKAIARTKGRNDCVVTDAPCPGGLGYSVTRGISTTESANLR